MDIVSELHQVLENIKELERGRAVRVGADAEEYRALVRRGICFVPYLSDEGLAFAPSRFVGYVGNKLSAHADNLDRDGRITNAALNRIFGSRPRSDASLERQYLAFCRHVNIQPSEGGAFGGARKYWVTSEAMDFLDANAIEEISRDPKITDTEKQQLVKARIGQGLFRERLLSYWKVCCLTGCDLQKILRASHIKPWRDCSHFERLDVHNGLLLAPNVDALFDSGLISFESSGKIVVSSQVSEAALMALGCNSEMKIPLTPKHLGYLAYHRERRFMGSAA